MPRKLTLAIFVLLLAGCAASPAHNVPNPFVPYALQDPSAVNFTDRKAYRLGKVKVTLDQMRVNPKFPDEAALNEMFTALLASQLAEKGLLASTDGKALELNVDIHYKRVFMGELFGLNKGFAGSSFSYASALHLEGSVLANFHSEQLTTASGAAGSLLKIGKQLTMTGSPEDEKKDLAVYAGAIAEALPR